MFYVNPLQSPWNTAEANGDNKLAQQRMAFREMEQYFAKELLSEMRKSVKQEGIFKGGPATKMFEEMLDDSLSAEMAKTGQLGIAKMLEEQLRIGELEKQINRDMMATDTMTNMPS